MYRACDSPSRTNEVVDSSIIGSDNYHDDETYRLFCVAHQLQPASCVQLFTTTYDNSVVLNSCTKLAGCMHAPLTNAKKTCLTTCLIAPAVRLTLLASSLHGSTPCLQSADIVVILGTCSVQRTDSVNSVGCTSYCRGAHHSTTLLQHNVTVHVEKHKGNMSL